MLRKTMAFSLVLMICISCISLSATRQEIQVALDIVRFTNVPNDFFEVSIHVAKGLNKVPDIDGQGKIVGERDMTIDEIKDDLIRTAQNARGYLNRVGDFLSDSESRGYAINGLSALGINIEDIESDITLMQNAANEIESMSNDATTQEDLNTIATYIEQTIPRLPLVRRKCINCK